MKNINIFILILAGIMITWGCSEIDNYDMPDSGVYGEVIDSISGKPIQTEQPNGFRIRMLEKGYENPVPIYFWGKEDGTFRNTKLFSNQYEVLPIEGAFFAPGAQTIDVNGLKEVKFTVTPFLGISASVKKEGKNIITKYTLKRTKTGDKITTRMTVCSANPRLNKNVFDKRISTSLAAIGDELILATQFSDTIKNVDFTKIKYVRVGASTSLGRYNYSEVFELK